MAQEKMLTILIEMYKKKRKPNCSLQPFSRVYNLASHATLSVCVLISTMTGRTFSLLYHF